MSRKVGVEERIRELARQQPGWTPSQIAIFLQGEQLKVTSEDVRRTLARPTPTPAAGTDATAASITSRPMYAAPREERRRSALPVGLLFGIILFLLTVGAQFLLDAVDAVTGSITYLGAFLILLLITGAVASRQYASGARAGMIAAFVGVALAGGTAALLYYTNRATYDTVLNTVPAEMEDFDLGFTQAVALAVGIAISLFASLVLGLIFGWLGAKLFGRRRRRSTFG